MSKTVKNCKNCQKLVNNGQQWSLNLMPCADSNTDTKKKKTKSFKQFYMAKNNCLLFSTYFRWPNKKFAHGGFVIQKKEEEQLFMFSN